MAGRDFDLHVRRRLVQRSAIACHLVEQVARPSGVMQAVPHVPARQTPRRANVVAQRQEVGEQTSETLGEIGRHGTAVTRDADMGIAAAAGRAGFVDSRRGMADIGPVASVPMGCVMAMNVISGVMMAVVAVMSGLRWQACDKDERERARNSADHWNTPCR